MLLLNAYHYGYFISYYIAYLSCAFTQCLIDMQHQNHQMQIKYYISILICSIRIIKTGQLLRIDGLCINYLLAHCLGLVAWYSLDQSTDVLGLVS